MKAKVWVDGGFVARRVALAASIVASILAVPASGVMAQAPGQAGTERAATLSDQRSGGQARGLTTQVASAQIASAGDSRKARLLEALKAETEVPVKVGEITLKIPVPPGHVRVSHDMPELYIAAQQTTQGTHFRPLVTFMPVEQAMDALAGERPGLGSAFSVVVDRRLEDRSASLADFNAVKKGVRSMNEKQAQAAVEAQRQRVNQNVQKELERYGDARNIAINEVKMEPVHLDKAGLIAFSMVARMKGLDEAQPDRLVTQVTTLGFVLANGKVLRLQNMGQDGVSLESLRTSFERWGDQIIALNPDGKQNQAVNAPAAGKPAGAAPQKVSMSLSPEPESSGAAASPKTGMTESEFWMATLKDAIGVIGALLMGLMLFRWIRHLRS